MELSHKHQVFLTVTIVIVMFIIILLMIRPTITGMQLSKEFQNIGMDLNSIIEQVEMTKTDAKTSNIKLESCENLNKEYINQVEEMTKTSYTCYEDKKKIESDIVIMRREYENNITSLEEELESKLSKQIEETSDDISSYKEDIQRLNDEITSLEEEMELIIKSAVNNICCKYKVDFPSTDSYFLSNNKIVCATGEEKKINC